MTTLLHPDDDPMSVASVVLPDLSDVDDRQSTLECSDCVPASQDAAYIKAAIERWGTGSNGDLEIDGDPRVSASENGAWVQAWVWVSNTEAGICDTCGAVGANDGQCDDCAKDTEIAHTG